MAYLNHTHGAAQNASGLSDFFARVTEAWARRRLYRQTVAELRELSDRELADLQLSRSSIYSVAREAVYGK
ncbi:hypothetical protein CDV50_13210 [Haematobacter massiliensis]|uniref:YjiS-like domain-containing protein n=1 Tax=Haematobacter massiliensis TaxID=195105 RepID=A0A086Y7M3_9RHOB|nr:DUF1127 domain-containing protein [Haematobacter massiliensis]KFI30273.1 hypothetical protein CN97_11760 [Haematobacter massiliensis]OWJ70576.1 hypothetical protein CDV50_13210 [Haematobacter massiliensis]OWJ87284.1 hypothetical protein CDV51_05905 [Haematobacter massiliensis]QBJ24734.1 DUF1127 domain-containing protein [Haematobacter massiliensis]